MQRLVIGILAQKTPLDQESPGISYKTQALYLTVFCTRYVDLLLGSWVSLYNAVMKIFFIGSSAYILYLMKFKYRQVLPTSVLLRSANRPLHRPTHDASLDTFRLDYLLPPVALMSIIFTYEYTPSEILWSFSIWLESVAILPQLFMLQRTGEAETITTHYLAALGLYRGLYIPNWIYR
jgi:ER lumen protein retaining receptor